MVLVHLQLLNLVDTATHLKLDSKAIILVFCEEVCLAAFQNVRDAFHRYN